MSHIYKSIDQLIGKTPLLELCNLEKTLNLKAKIFAKLEYFNPTGSVKDRAALKMITDAEQSGRINFSSTLIEPTSGNTGIGLAAIGVAKGYKVIIVMPDTMSQERIKLMQAYGAQVILSDGCKGMSGAIAKAKELCESIDNAVIMGQFENVSNPTAHYETTGPEILRDTDGILDFLISPFTWLLILPINSAIGVSFSYFVHLGFSCINFYFFKYSNICFDYWLLGYTVNFACVSSASLASPYLWPLSANLSWRGPNNKYFQLCRSQILF